MISHLFAYPPFLIFPITVSSLISINYLIDYYYKVFRVGSMSSFRISIQQQAFIVFKNITIEGSQIAAFNSK